MSTSTKVKNLKINKLTKEQYQGIEEPSSTELYFVLDEEDSLPPQAGQAGKYLTTNGTKASWEDVDSLPSQTGNAGKFLTTDGTDASWAEVQGGNGFNLFDIVMKDHILDFEESEGFGSLGTYVYKDAVAGSRYGYPDFYAKCLEEYQDVNNSTIAMSTNVNIVGNLTNNNGVLSGFSSTSWGVLPNNFSPSNNNWVVQIKFKTGTIGTVQHLLNSSSLAYQQVEIAIDTDGKMSSNAYINNTATPLYSILGFTMLNANTNYWVQLEYNNTTGYTLKLSTDGENFTTEATSGVTAIINQPYNLALGADFAHDGAYIEGAFTGSIDLKESYINIDGQRWWTGANTVAVNINGHKFYDIAVKDKIDTIYNSTGEAWFYGIDITNERIFLPRSTRFKNAQNASEVGEYQEAGLPNIEGGLATGTGRGWVYYSGGQGTGTGAITATNTGELANATGTGGGCINGFSFDASNSNPIYGNSDTVEYSSTKLIPYIVVGNTAQTQAITDVTDITSSENDTLPLFTGMYFEHKPNNAGWLLGGEQANSGSIYTTAYNELVNELTLPKYNLKVIEEEDMVSGTDYSEYWIVNQTQQYFICPTRLSYDALSGSEIPVYGNGMTLGMTNGTLNSGLGGNPSIGLMSWDNSYGEPVGSTNNTAQYQLNSIGVTTDPTKSGIVTNLNSAKSSTAKLYFKVANAVENLELLDAGEVMEALSSKVDTSSLSEIYPVVETYSNGASWYRVYSDGWCEQGGFCNGNAALTQISLLKNYKDTNYIVTISFNNNINSYASGNDFGGAYLQAYNKTTSSFYSYCQAANSQWGTVWRACGYIV